MDQSLSTRPRVCFEVEKVIGVSSDGNVRSYQVQWAPAWVSSFHLVGCEHLIQEFLQRQSVIQTELDGYLPNKGRNKIDDTLPPAQSMSEAEVPHFALESSDVSNQQVLPDRSQRNVNNRSLVDPHTSQASALIADENGTCSNAVPISVQNHVEFSSPNAQKEDEIPSDRYDVVVVKIEDDDTIIKDNLADSRHETNSDLMFPQHVSQFETDELSAPYSIDNYPSFLTKTNEKTSSSHINTFTAEKSNISELDQLKQVIKKYRCTQCDKGYSNSSGLKIHMRTHTGDRPYTCDLCNRGFNQNGDLQRHLRMHTGVKPFVCQICGRGFSRRHYLRGHMTSHDVT